VRQAAGADNSLAPLFCSERGEVISGVNASLILFVKMAVFVGAVSRGLAAGVVISTVS